MTTIFFYLSFTISKIQFYRYTWKIYTERLLTLAGVYGFWKHVSKLERRETRRYLEMFYILKLKDLVSIPLFPHSPLIPNELRIPFNFFNQVLVA